MQEDRDIVLFSDDDGNDIELEVIDYFFHNGQEYAVLTDSDDEDADCDACEDEDCDCDVHSDVYIMKVMQVGEDMEEFVPVDEEMMDELIEIVNERFNESLEDEDDEDDDEDSEDGE